MRRLFLVLVGAIVILGAVLTGGFWGHASSAAAAGDPGRGAKIFQVCGACHSPVPNQNMTGPSLAGVWGRKAGSLASFDRYSPALKASGVVWDAKTLDAWLKSPSGFVPGSRMPFAGIANAQQRADLIAYLKDASAGKTPSGGQGGMGMAPHFTDLKKAATNRQVRSIRICRDSYFVTTADGKTAAFWEPNLRFKMDSSNQGPAAGAPVIVGAGSLGDRADIIFANPDEISTAIKREC